MPASVAVVRSRPSVADTRPDSDASDGAGSHGASACSVRPVTFTSTRPGRATAPLVPGSSSSRGTRAVPAIWPSCHCALNCSTASVEPSNVAPAMSAATGGNPSTVTVPLASVMVERALARLPRLSQLALTAPVAVVPSGTAPNARATASTSPTSPTNAARNGWSSGSRNRPARLSVLAPARRARSSTVKSSARSVTRAGRSSRRGRPPTVMSMSCRFTNPVAVARSLNAPSNVELKPTVPVTAPVSAPAVSANGCTSRRLTSAVPLKA